MASLRDIRKRIRSVKNTQQITKAMKMVSAAKLRRAQDRAIAARPYGQALEAMMAEVMGRADKQHLANPLLVLKPIQRAEIVLVTSDRGLAGGFNANVCRRAWKLSQELSGKQVAFTTLGKKGVDFLRQRGVHIRHDASALWKDLTYKNAESLADELSHRFLGGDVDAIYVVYNQFVSVVSQIPSTLTLLPFEATATNAAPGAPQVDYLYEPSASEVLANLVPRAVTVRLFRALLESFAAEHGARMASMDNATRNAGDMIGSLSLFYNRTRQAQITRELVEIISGAQAQR